MRITLVNVRGGANAYCSNREEQQCSTIEHHEQSASERAGKSDLYWTPYVHVVVRQLSMASDILQHTKYTQPKTCVETKPTILTWLKTGDSLHPDPEPHNPHMKQGDSLHPDPEPHNPHVKPGDSCHHEPGN
jgi:hypothetical protein